MEISSTFREILRSFLSEQVQFLVIGGYAVIAYGHPRMTKDLDLWVECSEENAERITEALESLGVVLPPTVQSQLHSPSQLVVLGNEPDRIDIVTGIRDFDFSAFEKRKKVISLDGISVPFVGLEDLRQLKAAAGRFQDLADLENLPKE